MALPPVTHSNIRHLYADMLWFGVLNGSAMGFLTIYAARLGASGLQIGWLTAGPAIINLAVSLPVVRLLENRPLSRATYFSALLQRIGYVALVFLPWLFIDAAQVHAMVWISLAMSLPATLFAISFNALFAEVVPADLRADVVGRRNALLAVSLTVSTLLSGWVLDNLAFPVNYQLVFGLGAAGGMLSVYHLSRLRPARSDRPAAAGNHLAPARPHLWEEVRRLADRLASPAALRLSRPNLGLLKGPFGRFIASYLIFYTFQYLCLPIFPLAYVHDMQLTDGMISLGAGLFYITMLAVSLRLGKLARRWGQHRLLWISAMGLSVYALAMGLAKGPFLFMVGSFLGGAIYAVISASLINRLMERVPDDERAAGMAFHNLALNMGILVGSLAGPLLADAIGVQPSLLVGAGLRLLAGLLMIWWA